MHTVMAQPPAAQQTESLSSHQHKNTPAAPLPYARLRQRVCELTSQERYDEATQLLHCIQRATQLTQPV